MTFQSDWLSQYHDGVELLFSLSSRTEPARPGYADGVVGHVYLQYARHRPDEERVYSAGVPKPSPGPGNSMMGLVAAETTEANADRAAKASKPTDMRGSMRAVGGKPCDRRVRTTEIGRMPLSTDQSSRGEWARGPAGYCLYRPG